MCCMVLFDQKYFWGICLQPNLKRQWNLEKAYKNGILLFLNHFYIMHKKNIFLQPNI